MLIIILTRTLALIVIELAIMLLGLAAILTFVVATLVVSILPISSAVLCHCKTASQSKQNCSTSGYPPSSLHKFSPIVMTFPF